MRYKLLVVTFILFSMTATPILSWIDADSVATLCAAPPAKKGNNTKKQTAKTANKKKPAKSTAPKKEVKKETPKKDNAKAKPAKKETAKKETVKKDSKKTSTKQVNKPTAPKSQAKAAKPKNKTNTKKSKQSTKTSLSPAQEAAAYQARVAEVQKHNARVAAYMNRDIAHRLGFWGQVGYSAIFPSAFSFDADQQTGFNPYAIGGVGGGFGLGYQLRYKRFLFTTGAELQFYNSFTGIAGADKGALLRTYDVKQYPLMTYTYSYADMRDQWTAGYVQLPLLFGMELEKWYWQAGAKIGVNVMGSSSLNSTLSTSIQDLELIDDLQDMYTHALVNGYSVPEYNQSLKFGINTAIAAEIGLNLEQWIQIKPKKKQSGKPSKAQQAAKNFRYRIALFAEYGVLNIQNTANIAAAATNDMPADFSPVLGQQLAAPEELYQKVNYTSALSTTTAQVGKINPFLVGVKLAVFYELPRKKKKMSPIPAEPSPRVVTMVTNAETGKAIAGTQVTFERLSSAKIVNKTTNNKGTVLARLPKDTYRVAATKLGFYPCDTIEYEHLYDMRDTLHFMLRPEPIPIIYTLCGYVYDAETRQPIDEAAVRVVASADTTHTYQGSTNEEGLFVSEMLRGQYQVNITGHGYMPLTQSVQFEQDTLRFYLTRIKEGIKVKIDNLFFASNKTTILPESEESLNELASFLQDNAMVTIRITGHTDAVGADDANMRLSIGRAKAVRADLISRGIDADRIEFEGKGETEPIATNDTEEGRAQNRRVEFVITGTAGEDIQQVY